MGALAVRRWDALSPDEKETILARSTATIFDDGLHAGVAEILADVRARGDEAVVSALAKFDDVHISAAELRVTEAEFAAARDAVSG